MKTGTAITLGEAAKLTGKDRTTLWRAAKEGRFSTWKDENGKTLVEPPELFRVFAPLPADVLDATLRFGGDATSRNVLDDHPKSLKNNVVRNVAQQVHEATLRLELEGLHRQNAALNEERERERRQHEETIRDLRDRLDASERERRAKDAQVTALLTDQSEKAKQPVEPPRRSWFGLRRRA